MPRSPATSRGSSDLALALFLEGFVAGRRALFLGESSARERLDAAASRLVTSLADAPRASFDVAVCTDLGAHREAPAQLVDRLAGTLAPGGVLVLGAPNHGLAGDGSHLGYEALYELVAGRFAHVRMLGQAPFQGWSVADFAGDGSLSFDGSLLGDATETPILFLAVASAHPVAIEPYLVVQTRAEAPVAAPSIALEQELRAAKAELDAANQHAEELEKTLSKRNEALTDIDGDLERLRMELASVRDESETRRTALQTTRVELEKLRAEQAGPPEDYDRLEATLAERAGAVAELEAEVARRGTLVRDLVEELRELRAGRVSSEGTALGDAERLASDLRGQLERLGGQLQILRTERDQLAKRVLESEVARTEAVFRADELAGHLAAARAAEVARLAEPAQPASSASAPSTEDLATLQSELEVLRSREAQLSGAVRGLQARLAETDEVRAQLEARVELTRLDLDSFRMRNKELERLLAEAREQFELELVRVTSSGRTAPGTESQADEVAKLVESERGLAEKVGALSGKLVAAREELEGLAADRDRARTEVLRHTAQIALVEEQSDGARRGFSARIAELDADLRALTSRTETLSVLATTAQAEAAARAAEHEGSRGELTGLRLRLADAEAALAAPRAPSADPAQAAELGALRARATELEQKQTELEARAAAEQKRAVDLGLSLASTLAELAQTRTELETRDATAARLEARADALARSLTEARATLADLATQVRSPSVPPRAMEGEALDPARPTDPELYVELEQLKQKLAAVSRDAEGQDLLMRSLAAQIEERNDRIRALEQRVVSSAPSTANDAQLAELQERAARLATELAQERQARRDVEAQDAARRSADGDARRLREQLMQREADLAALQGRAASSEREARAIRDTFAQARVGLEELLGSATASGDPTTADRVGALLRILSRV